jgi:hypothetical protein
MTEDILPIVPTAKLFKKRVIVICAFLAGPLVGGYMIAENFKNIGERSNNTRTLIITIAFTLVVTFALLLLPGLEKNPNIVFPMFFASVTSACIYFFQRDKLIELSRNGGVYYNNTRAFVVSLIGLAVYIGLAVGLIFLADLFFPGTEI